MHKNLFSLPLVPVFLLAFIFGLLPKTWAQQPCNCPTSFAWLKKTFEENDAGFAYALSQKGQAAYAAHTAAIENKLSTANNTTACANLMREWLLFFRKSHFYIGDLSQPVVDTTTKPWEKFPLSESAIKQQLAKASPGYEGIWKTGAYRIGIVKDGKMYKGSILSSGNKAWTPALLKLSINSDSSGVYYMGNFSAQEVTQATLINDNLLRMGSIFLEREFPMYQVDDSTALFGKLIRAEWPFMQTLSPKTILLRIPSFEEYQKAAIDSVLNANKAILDKTENLIIDIRNNGGGSDISYQNITPLLYTNPIRTVNVEFLSTPLNNTRMEGYLTQPGVTEEDRKEINEALNKLNANLGKFVNLRDGATVLTKTLDTVMPYPRNVGIITNENNGSTAEQFLLGAKQSKKVKLFGVTTMGVLDISNMHFVNSPDSLFNLGYCLSKSMRIPDMAIDGKGIMPDYYIDKTIVPERWVSFVQNILEQ